MNIDSVILKVGGSFYQIEPHHLEEVMMRMSRFGWDHEGGPQSLEEVSVWVYRHYLQDLVLYSGHRIPSKSESSKPSSEESQVENLEFPW